MTQDDPRCLENPTLLRGIRAPKGDQNAQNAPQWWEIESADHECRRANEVSWAILKYPACA